MEQEIEALVREANNGSREALESVLSYAQGYIYNLALRMLQNPADAEDAAQEILIKLVTNLAGFRGESAFSTWMYRIATNHLLNLRQRDVRTRQTSFELLSQRLEISLSRYAEQPEEQVESAELVEEVRRQCTLAMLLCLDDDDRLALLLGEVLQFSGSEAASIMNLSPAAYRKRLSRARQAVVDFMSQRCGLINPENPCRCHRHVRSKIAVGQIDPTHLRFNHPHDAASTAAVLEVDMPHLDQTRRAIALLRAHPSYPSPVDGQELLNRVFSAGDQDS